MIQDLCEWNHVHMILAISPKMSVSERRRSEINAMSENEKYQVSRKIFTCKI